jgi:hypothetical protein
VHYESLPIHPAGIGQARGGDMSRGHGAVTAGRPAVRGGQEAILREAESGWVIASSVSDIEASMA